MDNMLYIVAGLVIILLIAVLILRRQKAQPPARAIGETSEKRVKHTPAPEDTVNSSAAATKFDSLTIAERFLDQQRYDKAIEALERGLIQQPHDASLSLKLLNIYALTKQSDNFYRTYDAISAHSDAATIAQANELKSLIDQEHTQTTQILARTDKEKSADKPNANKEGYEALDFDVSTLPDEVHSHLQSSVHDSSSQPAISADLSSVELEHSLQDASDEHSFINESLSADASATSQPVDNSFDLTLDDLENETAQSEADDFDIFAADGFDETINPGPIDHSLNELSLDDVSFDSDDSLTVNDGLENQPLALEDTSLAFEPDTNSFVTTENISDDFALSFDEPTTASSPVESNKPTFEQKHTPAKSAFEKDFEEDFVLDFDDLAAQSGFDTPADDKALASNEAALPSDSSDFDFELDLEEEDSEPSPDVDQIADSDVLLFDDNTPIDDDFGLVDDTSLADDLVADNTVSADAPVIADQPKATTDFASQFAADFDFVNDLDNNQVTLDLAAKYLELGEYDSAKRLLNEVVHQGNSEQQSQAQALLQRTA